MCTGGDTTITRRAFAAAIATRRAFAAAKNCVNEGRSMPACLHEAALDFEQAQRANATPQRIPEAAAPTAARQVRERGPLGGDVARAVLRFRV
jgi:hypothetical protein